MSKQDPEQQWLREAFTSGKGPVEQTNACPDDEEIWSATRGKLGGPRIKELLHHSLECARCRQSWRAAACLADEAGLGAEAATPAESQGTVPSGAETQPAPAGRLLLFRSRHHTLVTAAAAVAATILLVFFLPTPVNREEAPGLSVMLAQQVKTELHRVGQDQPLAAGESLQAGDRLFLTLESDVPVHLYVINQDEAGTAAALFPVPGAQWENPLPPGGTHRLPGDVNWQYDSWEVGTAAGRESFMVVAALEPLPELESALALLQTGGPGGQVLRGAGGDAAGGEPDAAAAEAALSRALQALQQEIAPEAVVVREIVLQNPTAAD